MWLLLAPWLLLLLAAAGAGIYFTDRLLIAPQRDLYRRLSEQKRDIARLREENQRLETYVRLVGVLERRARIEVLEQFRSEKGGPLTKIRFTEIDMDGSPITAGLEFTLTGRDLYVDTLTIRFEQHFADQDDVLKGRSVMLFRRLFTSAMRPDEGLLLDVAGHAPQVYAGDESPTAFEANLWSRLWELAGNATLVRPPGVRLVNGDAPYTRLEKGRTYQVTLRPTGEVSIAIRTDTRTVK